MTQATKHPGPQRTLHALHLLGMLVLLISGLLLHRPPAGFSVSALRLAHVVIGVAVLAGLVVRVYYAFAGRWADFRSFGMGRRQWRLLPGTLRYYLLFLGPPPPEEEGYNPMQRLTYLAVVLLVVLQSLYGLALAWPNTFGNLVIRAGGLAALRATHYAATWLFVAFMVLHLYLVLTEARDQLRLMVLPGRSGSEVAGHGPGAGAGSGQHPVRG